MLSVTGSPEWRKVVGGSQQYVDKAARNLTAVITGTPVRAVTRLADGVEIRDDADQVSHFDAAVVATHPDQALALLTDATGEQRDVMGRTRGRESRGGLVITQAAYDVEIAHRRRDPVEHTVTHRMTTWLVDPDDLPRLPGLKHRLCRFDLADHVDVRAFLAGHGIEPHHILMLAQPRVYGYVFNPLTVFYCVSDDGALTHLVAEVRNTYGGRHTYFMKPDELRTNKAFYVSPFYPVDGEYTMRLPLPGEKLLVSITLHRDGERPFVAAMTGTRRPSAELSDALRRPFETRPVMAGIKRHGIALFIKGLRPHERSHDDQHRLDAHHG
jgi:uncharacterized protein